MEFKTLPFAQRTPEGFRLATFDEVTSATNRSKLKDILYGSENLRLLDGVLYNGTEISIEADSWPMEMLVVTQAPTPILRNSSLLRKELYSKVTLNDERRRIAFRLSFFFGDIEAIYWLLSESENKSKLEYLEKNIEKEVKSNFPDFLIMLKILFGSVQIGEGEVTESLDYAFKDYINEPENAIAIAEIVLDKCREARILNLESIVDSQIQRVAEMTVDTNQAEAKRFGILTKLLSECAHPLKYEVEVIRPNFGKVLKEATRRGYAGLAEALFKLPHTEYELEKDDVDKSGENLLHYAAKREYGHKIIEFLGKKCESLIHRRNEEGQTPLHVAAMHDNIELVRRVKEFLDPASTLKETLKATDSAGQTPLHLAACKGVVETVQLFLDCEPDLFKRDIAGKTVVHHAVRNRNGKDIAKKIVEALLSHLKSNEEKALLLWISAAGIGTADQAEDLDPDLKKFLVEEKSKIPTKVNVLQEAAMSRDSRLTWELLNRGGNISSIHDESAFRFVKKTIEKFSEQGTDQPTLTDTLGRNVLAECISAHFLNPYIKSPITVCVSGGSGSGKSSLMHQIEAYLLITAAQLAFPDFWGIENFNGAKKISLSSKGEQMCHKIEKGVYNLLEKVKYRDFKEAADRLSPQQRPRMSLVYLLRDYLPKYKAVYKALACMDFNQLMEGDENESVHESQGQSLGAVPRILTVNFNAGNYRRNTEAWAGLAVEITKEIENSMTWAQLWSTRCRNTWNRHSEDFYLCFLIPCVLLAVVGPWIGWAAWKLIDRAPPDFKNLKYGSLPLTVMLTVWPILRQGVTVFKTISTQISGYFTMPDHSQHLGYQQTVISDINFLREEIGKRALFIFSFIAGEMFNNWWGLWKENVKDTCIPQYGSAPQDKLRIIAFVDDLDQCEDTDILRVLWAINLVFRVCEINVILTMDKASIQTAHRKSSWVEDKDFVDKFTSKIVQLPVNIPDPTDEEWVGFLYTELLRNEEGHFEDLLSNEQAGIDGGNVGESEEVDGPKDIESGNSPIKYEGWSITFLYDWLRPLRKEIASCFRSFIHHILQFLCFVVCNIRDETHRNQPDSRDETHRNQPVSRDETQTHRPLRVNMKMLTQRAQQVRDMLMLSYTDEEAMTFHYLKSYATGIQKLPREWKNCMNYHKFARNAVSKMGKKNTSYPVGWEVEFVVWTFVCSQWKDEMNLLIKDWYKYADDKYSHGQAKLKSSLKKIVADYIEERKWGERTECQAEITKSTQSPSVETQEKERERWENLKKCLENVHDVSLEGIRCFQHFRYHCDARNLISKLYKPKKISYA